MEKQRILLIATEFPPSWGGVATYSYQLAKGFQQQGHEVTVLSGKSQSEDSFPFPVHRKGLGSTGITSIPYLTFHLLKLLKNEKFDHVICTLWLPEALSFWLAKKILSQNIPYSISVHAMEVVDSEESLKKKFRKKLTPLKEKVFQQAHKIFCVSQYSKDLIQSLVSLKEGQAVVINNGADPNAFKPTQLRTNHPYPELLTACRLLPNKGIDQVLMSLPELIEKFPYLTYHICGEGPDLDRLNQLVSELKISKQVQFYGKVTLDLLNKRFQSADLFVMLSRQEKHFVEGFGLVFLESALCGTASLGGRSGGIPDAIEDGITGWLVDPEDKQAITTKLTEILQDPERLEQVGRVALAKTLNEKTWTHRLKQFAHELGI